MTDTAQKTIDWRKEYEWHSDLWHEQCKKRWGRAEELILAGYKIVMLRILSKQTLPREEGLGIHNPITTVTALKHRTEPGAAYYDHNYGIVTGVGTCVVVDLDATNTPNGLEVLMDLEQKHGFKVPRNCMVATPSGGYHLYLAWDEGVLSATRPMGREIPIDVSSSTGDIPTRHVVGPESVLESNVYRELDGARIISAGLLTELPMPLKLKQLLAPQARPNVVGIGTGKPISMGSSRGSEETDEDDMFESPSLTEIGKMLANIDCTLVSYDEWVKVGMAIKRERGDAGYDLWVEWSSSDKARFDIKACRTHWESFRDTHLNPVTIGTVINMARKNGYTVPKSQRAISLMERIQAETPNVYVGGACKFLHVTSEGAVQVMAREDARSWYEGEEVWVGKKPYNPLDIFMKWNGRIKYETFELRPPPWGKDPLYPIPETIFNVWIGYRLEPKPGPMTPYLELFNNMFPNEDEREWVHDWFADLIQNTGVKASTALVMVGPQGTGKNTLLNVFRKMFHRHNTTQFVNTDQFVSSFNMHVVRSVLAIVNEAVWAGNHKHSSTLKGYITEEEFEVQDKNIRSFQARNCTRFVIMTNEEWAVPADGDARRFCVTEIPRTVPIGDPWWKKTRDVLEDDRIIAAVMYWYKTRKITNNLKQVPQTQQLKLQQYLTRERMASSNAIDPGAMVKVVLRIMRDGQAVFREADSIQVKGKTIEGYSGWLVSSAMVRRAKSALTGKVASDDTTNAIRQFLNNQLRGIHVPPSVRVKVKGTQRMAIVLPALDVLRDAMAAHLRIDPNDIDCPDEWTESELTW
jgi:ABC-type cobalamin/Fe3+-siderophores transport system ATPase subunit